MTKTNEITIRKLIMNTNTASKHAAELNAARSSKHIARPTAVRVALALMAAGVLLAVPSARAETPLSTADKDFILAAAQGGMTEVKLGEMAAQKGKREDVKAFGQMMVKDHTGINDGLKALAALKGVTLPEHLDAKHQGQLDKMTALTDSEFDQAYIKGMIKDHKMDVREFKAESSETQDADIKSFLDKSIPVVDGHLQRINALKKSQS
jgi:putative membrane protein